MTRVKFYIDRCSVFAVFPDIQADSEFNVLSYEHVGQHSACSPRYYRNKKLATPEQYADLLKELESQGYDDLVVSHERANLNRKSKTV